MRLVWQCGGVDRLNQRYRCYFYVVITNLHLKAGRIPEASGETVVPTHMTVFVGPNNSGKSKILSEIGQFCRSGPQANLLVLRSLQFSELTPDEANVAIDRIELPPNPGEYMEDGSVFVGNNKGGRVNVSRDTLQRALQHPESLMQIFCQWFMTFKTMMLDGKSRINLVDEQTAGDLQLPAQNSLDVLLRDDVKRSEVRRIIKEAFDTYFVVDPTNLGRLRIRLSERPPANDMEERGIHKEAVQFHADALPIEQSSDGVKAFTGMITEIIAGDPQIVLVDEPEAFLHPSLSTKLGVELSRAAISTDKKVFVSTHSPTFVMGCVQSGVQLNIVRLTYRGGIATSRILPSAEILQLMRNPLLRSTGVLSGLFHEFVVITEADSDRAFYQEINERLLRYKPEWGIPNCLFINAQNKQTIRTILKPLRKLGIPAVGILDIDALKGGGKEWTDLLAAANVPEGSYTSLSALRSSVKESLEPNEIKRDMKRDGGISILEEGEQETASSLLDQLANYGIFLVPNGELESWLKPVGASGHGSKWLIQMFELMGEDPKTDNYLHPSEDDVWNFMSQIKSWLINPTRKGIPS